VGQGAISSVVTSGETWELQANDQTDIAGYNTELSAYIARNVASGSHTITVQSSDGYYTLLVVEVISDVGLLDSAHAAIRFDATEPHTSGGITTTTADCALVSGIIHGGGNGSTFNANQSGGSAWTLQEEITNGGTNWVGAIATRIVSSTGAYDCDWGNANNEDAICFVIDIPEVSAGGATPKGVFNNPFYGPFGGPI